MVLGYKKEAAEGRPPLSSFCPVYSAAAAGAHFLIALLAVNAVGREELVDRELNLSEQFAGVFPAVVTAAGALLLGHAVVVHGHEQLGVALQPDNGELTQRHIEAVNIAAGHQLLRETGSDRRGDFRTAALAGAALAHIHQLQVKDDGIHRLYHSSGCSGAGQTLGIRAALGSGGRKDLGAPLAAKEDNALIKDSQAADFHRPGGAHKGISRNTIEIPHIHCVASPVKAHRFHINVSVQKLGAAGFYRCGAINGLLGSTGWIYPQIFDAVLIGR